MVQAQLDGAWLPEGDRKEQPDPSVSARLYVGADVFNNYLWGYIAELLIYRRTLSDGEAQEVSQYLNRKWTARPANRISLSEGQARLFMTNLTPGVSYFVQRAFTLYPLDGWTTVAQFDSPAQEFEWGEPLEEAWRAVFYRVGYAQGM